MLNVQTFLVSLTEVEAANYGCFLHEVWTVQSRYRDKALFDSEARREPPLPGYRQLETGAMAIASHDRYLAFYADCHSQIFKVHGRRWHAPRRTGDLTRHRNS